MSQVSDDGIVIMLLRTLFIEGQDRYVSIFESNNPIRIYTFVKRTYGLINGDSKNRTSSAMSHSWFIWKKSYRGPTELKWLDNRFDLHKI